MTNTVVAQMQANRMAGNIDLYVRQEERQAELAKMGAVNAYAAPLPLSPCLKEKQADGKGTVHKWIQMFADMPDAFENCDEYGNTDPATWVGRGPQVMRRVDHQVQSMVNPDDGSYKEPEVKVDSEVVSLGVVKEFVTDYSQKEAIHVPEPLKASSSQESVLDLIDALQKEL